MRKGNTTVSIIGLLILLALLIVPEHWKAILFILFSVLVCYLIAKVVSLKKRKKFLKENTYNPLENSHVPLEDVTTDTQQTNYLLKNSIITIREKPYFETIRKIIEPQYIIQPQVNLASIIDKKSPDKFRNELFRNIDFGIFDQNYKPLVLIEINDESHMTINRRERDQKVQSICKSAGIPIITLWTKYGVNESYINKRLSEHLSLPINTFTENQKAVTEQQEKNNSNMEDD